MRVDVLETNLQFGDLTELSVVDGIVVHQTGDTDIDASAADIHQWHRANGWSGIGYHKVFRKSGLVERGRPDWARGAHSPGANSHTLGYHVCGSFSSQLPNEAQLQSLVYSLADDCEKYNLDPFTAISGHRDWLATECPGQALYDFLPELRQRVAAEMGVA